MKHVITARQGDQKLFSAFYDRLTALSDEKLIEAYYREVNLGITGVHAQAVYVLALRKVMKERFGKNFIAADGEVLDLG